MIKCPNCGSTAQVGWVWGDDNIYSMVRENDFVCGCGCEFTIRYEAATIEITKGGKQ